MLKLGIIGAGDVVRVRHLPILAEFFADTLKIVGISTRREQASREVNSLIGYQVPQYLDYEDVLDLRPDCVLVAVPTGVTEQVCSDSLSRSIATYSEKPMAQSYIGALRLKELALRQRAPYLVGENFYFQRRFQTAERWIAETGAHVREMIISDQLRRGGRENPRSDNDLIWEHIPHALNAARRLVGHKLATESVSATIIARDGATELSLATFGEDGFNTSIHLRIQEEWSQDDYGVKFDDGQVLRISHRYDFDTRTYTDALRLGSRQEEVRRAECGIHDCWETFLSLLGGRQKTPADLTVDLALEQTQLIEAAKLSSSHGGIDVPVSGT
jgi:predicted dehydrogenase